MKITHGRHCTCSACAAEDWTNPDLAPCGMHGSACARIYQPWGVAGDEVASYRDWPADVRAKVAAALRDGYLGMSEDEWVKAVLDAIRDDVVLKSEMRRQLNGMRLWDDTGDPGDEGYMGAIKELDEAFDLGYESGYSGGAFSD